MCARIRWRNPLFAFDSFTLYKESIETKLIQNRNIESFPTYCIPILCSAPSRFIDLYRYVAFLPRIHWVDIITHYLVIVCDIVHINKRTIL